MKYEEFRSELREKFIQSICEEAAKTAQLTICLIESMRQDGKSGDEILNTIIYCQKQYIEKCPEAALEMNCLIREENSKSQKVSNE